MGQRSRKGKVGVSRICQNCECNGYLTEEPISYQNINDNSFILPNPRTHSCIDLSLALLPFPSRCATKSAADRARMSLTNGKLADHSEDHLPPFRVDAGLRSFNHCAKSPPDILYKAHV